MSLRERMPNALPSMLLTVWMVGLILVYFRQFAEPALRYLSRAVVHH